MSDELAIDLHKIYEPEKIPEFNKGCSEIEEILLQLRIQESVAKGLITLTSGKRVKIKNPPKFPGKPLSEYLREIRE